MKKVSNKIIALAAGAALVMSFGLYACASNPAPEPEATDVTAEETEAADEAADETAEAPEAADAAVLSAEGADATSILAVPAHAAAGFTEESIADVSTCATCHSYESLVEAGECKLIDPDSGTEANPHSNHQYLGCTDCHSVSGQSVVYCNSCHEFLTPEGWTNPEMDAAELGYEFDVSGLDLPPYAEAGRNTDKLTPEQLSGVAALQANPAMMDEVMASFMASAMGPEAFAAMAAAQAEAAADAPAEVPAE